MELKKFSLKEMKNLEDKILAKHLSICNLIDFIDAVRTKYFNENKPEDQNRPSILFDYAYDINAFLKWSLITPAGCSIYTDKSYYHEDIKFSLLRLRLMREDNVAPFLNLLKQIKDYDWNAKNIELLDKEKLQEICEAKASQPEEKISCFVFNPASLYIRVSTTVFDQDNKLIEYKTYK